MERYTGTTEIAFNDLRDSRAIVVEGEVILHSWNSVEWVVGETLTVGSYEVFTKGLRLKIELVSGASFAVDMGGEK